MCVKLAGKKQGLRRKKVQYPARSLQYVRFCARGNPGTMHKVRRLEARSCAEKNQGNMREA